MHDVGGGLPLWDEDGRLPEEVEFLHGFLGLSVQLVTDLTSWSNAIEAGRPSTDLDLDLDELRERLADELGEGFEVSADPSL